MKVENSGKYVDILSDNANFLIIRRQNEYTHPEFYAEVVRENLVFKLGMCFSNVKEFREAVGNSAIKYEDM